MSPALLTAPAPTSPALEAYHRRLAFWRQNPVHFVSDVLGGTPEPWQCDVLDALSVHDRVAVRSCHGVGKTAVIAWSVLWFALLREYSRTIITAPTFDRQVAKIAFPEIQRWFMAAQKVSPALCAGWKFGTAIFHYEALKDLWYVLGVPSNQALNVEGFHAGDILTVIDEAKAVPAPIWASMTGMQTTRAKMLAVSTPGHPSGYFHKVFADMRTTWKSLFVIHPSFLRQSFDPPRPACEPVNRSHRREDRRPPTRTGGDIAALRAATTGERTYYSDRPPLKWGQDAAADWGVDSALYVSKVVGDFPNVDGDVLVPWNLIQDAIHRTQGCDGDVWVSCDVARYGRDRTVVLVGKGGTVLAGEVIAKNPAASTAQEVQQYGVGADAKRPQYRSILATADVVVRLVLAWGAVGAIVDDSGLGAELTDEIRRRGIKCVPFQGGAPPPDTPRTPELARLRRLQNKLPSNFQNLKAKCAWALRAGFELGAISLAALPAVIRDPLVSQTSMVKIGYTDRMQMKVIDPDEDELSKDSLPGDDEEQRRSPDHFHALMMLWWVAGTAAHLLDPQARAVIPGQFATAGRRPRVAPSGAIQPNPVAGARMGVIGRGSQAHYLGGIWKGR